MHAVFFDSKSCQKIIEAACFCVPILGSSPVMNISYPDLVHKIRPPKTPTETCTQNIRTRSGQQLFVYCFSHGHVRRIDHYPNSFKENVDLKSITKVMLSKMGAQKIHFKIFLTVDIPEFRENKKNVENARLCEENKQAQTLLKV